MSDKELFKIALKYVEKSYSYETLKYGDDLYNATKEEVEICLDFYDKIQENGTNWACEHLEIL